MEAGEEGSQGLTQQEGRPQGREHGGRGRRVERRRVRGGCRVVDDKRARERHWRVQSPPSHRPHARNLPGSAGCEQDRIAGRHRAGRDGSSGRQEQVRCRCRDGAAAFERDARERCARGGVPMREGVDGRRPSKPVGDHVADPQVVHPYPDGEGSAVGDDRGGCGEAEVRLVRLESRRVVDRLYGRTRPAGRGRVGDWAGRRERRARIGIGRCGRRRVRAGRDRSSRSSVRRGSGPITLVDARKPYTRDVQHRLPGGERPDTRRQRLIHPENQIPARRFQLACAANQPRAGAAREGGVRVREGGSAGAEGGYHREAARVAAGGAGGLVEH